MILSNKNVKLIVGDIETIACVTDLGFYNPDTGEWFEFQISEYKNDLYSFIKFYTGKNWDYVCGYNYLSFDSQVIQFIINEHKNWFEFDGLVIAQKVYEFTQMLIDNQKYNLFNPYKESNLEIAVIDVFLIFGLNNEARMSSLKKCEFQIDYHSVEEMPIHHSSKDLTIVEIDEIQQYRRNDVLATYELLKIAKGDTSHNIYKGNNQFELRADIESEFGLKCMNFSDIKIGDELIKLAYADAIKKKVVDLPRRGTFRKSISLSKCLPEYISFKTSKLQNLLKSIKSTSISQTDKWEESFTINNTKYIQALGGLHSVNKDQIFKADKHVKIITADVASMYPRTIIANSYYPKHLGIELLRIYTALYDRRVKLKPLSKTDNRIKGICDALKLQMNVVFGKLGSMESWLYDKQTLLSVTLTGQFSLLMLIEDLELNGIQVIIANTDGIEAIVPIDKEELYNEVCKKWEETTGYILEYDEYDKIFMSSVNDYIAITTSGKIKKKGEFITDFELWKNKSSRIIPLALEAYFTKGQDPISFIKNHSNIYDFCIMARAAGKLYLEMDSEQETKKLKKLVRYYLSSSSKWALYKRGVGNTGKNMNVRVNAPNIIGDIHIEYFNQFKQNDNYEIAYEHYILKVLKIIDKMEKTNKAKMYAEKFKPQIQLGLF